MELYELKMALHKGLIKKKNAVKLFNLLKYGELTCEICLRPIKKPGDGQNRLTKRLTFDHIIPKSLEGNNSFNNLQIAHLTCNQKKGGLYHV